MIDTSGTLYDSLARHAENQPSAPAIVLFDGTTYDFAYLKRQADRIAAALRSKGVQPGDRVAVKLEKSIEALAALFGVFRAGAIFLPINTQYSRREVTDIAEDAEPRLMIGSQEGAADVDGLPFVSLDLGSPDGEDLLEATPLDATPDDQPPGPSDLAAMLYTSGTTGRPKGAPLSHGNLTANLSALAQFWKIGANDRVLHILPMFHAHGLFLAAAMPLGVGGSLILVEKFTTEATLAKIPEATVLMAVPAIYSRLLADPAFNAETCRNLRLATSGSAPLSPELFDAIAQRSGLNIVERYGSTETCIITSNPLEGQRKVGSVGVPLPNIDVRIVDRNGRPVEQGEVGRVQINSPATISGYWQRPDLTDEWTSDGYFDVGDLGKLDEDGYLYLVGRSKELIISGGYNVYPREVEIVVANLDGVREAAVFGAPHPDFGEGVVCAVTLSSGEAVDENEIAAAIKPDLAAYKRPKKIVILDEFPRNAMGKILKNDLKDRYASIFNS
ncbi:AMP-binding protein [Notoacmeibacter ruber]|nr:AMP-binding protein [Notoacmeibacter ruber]